MFGILDTEVEARYDDLTTLVAKFCDVPICLISLIDEDRQWFKSHHGLDVRETPREVAFCSHAILGEDILEIEDSRQDDRFHDNPLVTDSPNVIFYAGMPLKDIEANNLGTLCVIDNKPNKLSEEQRNVLRVIAREVMTHFELHRALRTTQDLLNTAQHLAQSKSTFMSNISHEIRAPIQGIRGVTDCLKQSGLSDRQLKLLDILQESSYTLELLNRDMTDLAMIETGRLKIMAEPFDIHALLLQLAIDHKHHFDSKANRLRLTVNPELRMLAIGDSNRIRQVLGQLLAHANNVTNAGEIHLDAKAIYKESGGFALDLTLIDEGPQLPETVLVNLFERFEEVEACHAAELASTGIDLAIAYKLTRLMGGDLTVKSGESTGSIFNMTLEFAGE